MPSRRISLPSTLRRSPAKAQRTYRTTLDSALGTYDGDEARAHRTAFAAVKHGFEKVGDRWQPKRRPGPSDSRGRLGRGKGRTAGGVDAVGNSRDELLERAARLGVKGRWRMTKQALAEAIAERQRR